MNETERDISSIHIRNIAAVAEAKSDLISYALKMKIILERFDDRPPELEFWQRLIETIIKEEYGQAQ